MVGDGGRRWEFLGDSGRLEGGDRGGWGAGDERVRQCWGGGRIGSKLHIFKSFSCDLSFGLGYGSLEGVNGSLLQSVVTI